MQPEIRLDSNVLRQNAIQWRELAGTSLRAVIKSNGYGWGFKTIVDAIDDLVDGYYVSDIDEFLQVAPLTKRPISTLVDVPAHRLGDVLERNGIPTLSTLDGLHAADAWARTNARRPRVRVAIRGAVGWSGIAIDRIGRFARILAGLQSDVEVSSHITDASLQAEQTAIFETAIAVLRTAGASLVATDLASSAPLAANVGRYSHVRLGVGLFGARFGASVNVRSAIVVRAAVVERLEARGQRVGYGLGLAPFDGFLIVVRCGYGDGFPRLRRPMNDTLAVGMQFTTLHRAAAFAQPAIDLIDRETDLDLLAASATISVHELVVALGSHSSANSGRRQ